MHWNRTCPSGCRLLAACGSLCRDASGPHQECRCALRSFSSASACVCCALLATASGTCKMERCVSTKAYMKTSCLNVQSTSHACCQAFRGYRFA